MNKKKVTGKTVLLYLAVIALAILCVAFLPKILSFCGYIIWLFTPFIIAYIISLLVNPMADGLQKRFRLPRGISAILVIVLTVGVIGGIAAGIIWKIIEEIRNVYEDLPVIYENIRMTWYRISYNVSNFTAMLPDSFQLVIEDFSEQVLDGLANFAKDAEIVRSAGNVAKKLPNIFVTAIVFLLSLYFMVADAKAVSKAIKKPFTETFVNRMSELRAEFKKYVGGYVKAQLTIMCISFTILLIGLSILGTHYRLVIALAVAVFDALPIFGSGAVLIPWSLVSFITGDIGRGIGLLIIYLTVILMRQLVEPKIVSKNIGMHPLMTLIAMYIGYRVMSIGGMILGPLMLVLIVNLYRVGVFDTPINAVKNISLKIVGEIKKIKIGNEGEE